MVKFPWVDQYNVEWYDSTGFKSEHMGKCFICNNPCDRMDANFAAYFCNSVACNKTIDLELSQGNDSGTGDWFWEGGR